MLFSLRSQDPRETIISLLLLLPIILISLTVHEYSHGYTAYRLGDPTARNLGRLTLNPLKHIDPFGFIMLILAGFGWAKPVPINTRYLKHGRWGMAAVSFAGPFSNLVLGFLGMVVYRVLAKYFGDSISMQLGTVLQTFFSYFVFINIGLFVFNLFPIPPLDGSRILAAVLPQRIAMKYLQYEMYIQIALFALLFFGVLSPVIVTLRDFIINGMDFILNLIPFLK